MTFEQEPEHDTFFTDVEFTASEDRLTAEGTSGDEAFPSCCGRATSESGCSEAGASKAPWEDV